MVSIRSDSSQQSDGGLSWVGSFVGSIEDDDLEEYGERQDRMSSVMAPGGVKFEKGKWVSAWRHEKLAGNKSGTTLDPEMLTLVRTPTVTADYLHGVLIN